MMQENKALEKKMNIASVVVSIVVIALVVLMRGDDKPDLGIDFSFLPPFYSTLNALCAIALAAALYFIKQKNIEAHRKSIYVAFGLSILFLGCYVLYHFTTPETKYCMEGNIRYVYFFLLITHIILAGVILPFILLTFTRAYTGQIARHKKMARWVWPFWFYVAITGPVIYLMLRPCY